MSMSGFNRNNPLVIMMNNIRNSIEVELLELIKKNMLMILFHIFVNIVLLIEIIILIVSDHISNMNILIFPILNIFIIGIICNKINNIKKKSSISKVDEIIHGDEYKDLYVNNEKIYDLVCKLKAIEETIKNAYYDLRDLYYIITAISVITIICISLDIF